MNLKTHRTYFFLFISLLNQLQTLKKYKYANWRGGVFFERC